MLYWKKSKNRNPNPYWRSKHRQAKGKVKYFQKLEKKKTGNGLNKEDTELGSTEIQPWTS